MKFTNSSISLILKQLKAFLFLAFSIDSLSGKALNYDRKLNQATPFKFHDFAISSCRQKENNTQSFRFSEF